MNPITVSDEKIASCCAKGTIYLIDDDALLLESLRELLIDEGYAVLPFNDADDFVLFLTSSLPRYPGPRCVISDVHMPKMDGLAIQKYLQQESDLPLILMSGLQKMDDIIIGFRSGAIDFLLKPIEVDRLLEVIKKALQLDWDRFNQAKNQNSIYSAVAMLTDRELQVIRLVSQGRLNKQIAEDLGIALRTVKLHRQRAMEKLGIEKAVQLGSFVESGVL